MSESRLEELLAIASSAIQPASPDCGRLQEAFGAQKGLDDLCLLLQRRNGFLAFENALLVFPAEPVGDLPGIVEWNRADGWRRHYRGLTSELVFFAADAFLGQFALSRSGVMRLEPRMAPCHPAAGSSASAHSFWGETTSPRTSWRFRVRGPWRNSELSASRSARPRTASP